MENSKELQKLIEENMELRPVGKKMVEISRDEELQGIYDGEEHLRKVRNSLVASALKEGWNKGIKEGIKEGVIKTAENLLNKGIDKNIISECTGLSTKEIDNLK